MKEKIISLRAHHLLCSVLYEGKGYSDSFVNNMNLVVDKLMNNCLVKIIKSPDNICEECPNALADGRCALDKDAKEIKDIDSFIFDSFNINVNEESRSFDFYNRINQKINKQIFDSCCGECRWQKQGLCSYEKYVDKLKKIIK